MPANSLRRMATAVSLIFASLSVCQCGGWWPIVDPEYVFTRAADELGFVQADARTASSEIIPLNEAGESVVLQARLMESIDCPKAGDVSYRLICLVSPVHSRDLSQPLRIRFSHMRVRLAGEEMKLDRDMSKKDGTKIKKWQNAAWAAFDLSANDQLCPGNDTLLYEDPCLVFEFDSVFRLGDNYVNVEPIFARPPRR
jgi:hypothetical protein